MTHYKSLFPQVMWNVRSGIYHGHACSHQLKNIIVESKVFTPHKRIKKLVRVKMEEWLCIELTSTWILKLKPNFLRKALSQIEGLLTLEIFLEQIGIMNMTTRQPYQH